MNSIKLCPANFILINAILFLLSATIHGKYIDPQEEDQPGEDVSYWDQVDLPHYSSQDKRAKQSSYIRFGKRDSDQNDDDEEQVSSFCCF